MKIGGFVEIFCALKNHIYVISMPRNIIKSDNQ